MGAFVSSRGWSLVVWLIVFNVLLMIVLMLRWYAAQIHRRSFRLDDFFIMMAYVCFGFGLLLTYRLRRCLSFLGLSPCNGGRHSLGCVKDVPPLIFTN